MDFYFKLKHPHGGESVAVIQLNCSTAGPTGKGSKWKIDPTIGKVLSWCYENQESLFEVVHCLNLFSYVDPKPGNLINLNLETLNKPGNDRWIKESFNSVSS